MRTSNLRVIWEEQNFRWSSTESFIVERYAHGVSKRFPLQKFLEVLCYWRDIAFDYEHCQIVATKLMAMEGKYRFPISAITCTIRKLFLRTLHLWPLCGDFDFMIFYRFSQKIRI